MKALFLIPFVILPSFGLAGYSGYQWYKGGTNDEPIYRLIFSIIMLVFGVMMVL